MGDGNAGLTQLLAEEYVFVAIGEELLVEGVSEHDLTMNKEVGGVEMLIGAQASLLGGVLMFA